MGEKLGAGITCPSCSSTDMKVVDSRPGPTYIRRRRKCGVCANVRVTTIECIAVEAIHDAIRIQQTIGGLPAHRRELVLTLIRELGDNPSL